MMSIFFVSSLLILGLIGGFMAGLLGIGGGIIFVPMMILLFDMQGMHSDLVAHLAIATTMATIFFTALSSVRAHHRYRAIEWPLVLIISPGILLGTLIGGKVFNALHTGSLMLLFAGFIGFSSWQMLRNRAKRIASAEHALPSKLMLMLVGIGIGFICSLIGVGGGFISVPFLNWCHVPIRRAVATSAALGLPIAAFATINNIYYGYGLADLPRGSLGYVYLPALACIATVSILSAPLGVKLAHKIDAHHLKRIFSMLLCLLSIYMLAQGLRNFDLF